MQHHAVKVTPFGILPFDKFNFPFSEILLQFSFAYHSFFYRLMDLIMHQSIHMMAGSEAIFVNPLRMLPYPSFQIVGSTYI